MSNVSLVSLDVYHAHQYEGLVAEYQRLIWAGLDFDVYLSAAQRKWGLDLDGAELAYYEAKENS